jgi:hypothetical protein
MAQIEEVEDDVPSTPPNTTGSDISGPQSVRRESTCLRTPINCPGFIPTSCDSRRALVPVATTDKTQKSKPSTVAHKDQLPSGTTNLGSQVVDKNNCRVRNSISLFFTYFISPIAESLFPSHKFVE